MKRETFGFIIGFFAILLVPSYLAWKTIEFWKMKDGIVMISLVLLGYPTSFHIISKLVIFPRVEYTGIILTVITFIYLLIIGILALGRIYYSRSFLGTAYILNIIWVLCFYLFNKRKRLRLAMLPFDQDGELLKIKEIDWIILDTPYKNLDIDGLVISSIENLPLEWRQYIVNQTLKGIRVYSILNIYENILGKIPIRYFYAGYLENKLEHSITRLIKRIFDFCIAILLSPLVLLICVIIAILIKLDSDGPVLFKQERVGEKGKIFEVIKFRSMYKDSEKDGPKFAEEDDPRITRIGHILRRFHLDELPQLWNVLKGDMSLIGPRPEQVQFVKEFEKKIPHYNLRHLVKPGITGWAQVHYGYAVGLEETYEKLEYDLYYIKNLSIWLDIVILLKTLRMFFSNLK